MINESLQKVTDGTELVNRCGKVLEEIVASVKRVTDVVSEIAAASQEQTTGIEQVSKAIMQMNETTQQNAALVEESASAAENLQQQAAELLQQVEFFKVSDEAGSGLCVGLPRGQAVATRKPVAPAAAHLSGHKPATAVKQTKRTLEPKEEPIPVWTSKDGGNGHGTLHAAMKDGFEEF